MKTKRHICLTLLLAAAPLASAQAPAKVDPTTPEATPEVPSPPATTPRNVLPPPELPSNSGPAAAEPEAAPHPATVPAGPGGARNSYEKHSLPPAPQYVQDAHSDAVWALVAPSPGAGGGTGAYFNDIWYGTAAAPTPPPPGRAEQIIRDTKLKVIQSHYETALSELMTAERALIDATDDKRSAMETRLKGLKGFVEKLEAEIKTLAAGLASDAPTGTVGGPGSRSRRGRAGAGASPAAGAPELPNDSKTAPYSPGKATGPARLPDGPGGAAYDTPAEASVAPRAPVRVPASRGRISDGSGGEIRLHSPDDPAEPVPAPTPRKR